MGRLSVAIICKEPQYKSRFVSDLTNRVILINPLQGDLQPKKYWFVVLAVLNC